MKPEAHGGDLLRMAATAGRDPASLLDFSVNVRPEGPPEFIRAALFRAMTALAAYPSPHAEEAMLAAARHHGMDASRFVFGSGSNELIHALARVLRKRGVSSVRVVEPAFSEYAIACRLAGIKAIRPHSRSARRAPRCPRGIGGLPCQSRQPFGVVPYSGGMPAPHVLALRSPLDH